MARKSNILLILGDEHPVFMAGCYGDPVARTPTLDALAARGAVFDAAYCASPICAPCRAAMMTGRHVHAIEAWDNAAPLASDWPTFAHAFRAAGYRTILCGKMHYVGADQLHGFAERPVPDIYPADFSWTQSHRGGVPVSFGGQHRRSVLKAGPGRTEDMAYDELVVREAEAALRRMRPGEPFLLVVSMTGPHYPYMCPRQYWDLFDGSRIPMPELPADFAAGEHEHVRWLRHYGGFEQPVPEEVCRAARRAIYGRIAMVDEYVARVLAALRAGGRAEDTFVCYSSDHGDMMGEHALWYKNVAYEWSARVPWIVAGPGVACGRFAETVSLLDMGPTLAGLAGVPPLEVPTDGRDLAPLLRGERSPGVGEAIFEYYGEGVARGVRTIVRGPHKLTVCPATTPALYDLAADPGEWHNLAADPAHAAALTDLTAAVHADWGDPAEHDARRLASEARRLAIIKAIGDADDKLWRPDWRKMV